MSVIQHFSKIYFMFLNAKQSLWLLLFFCEYIHKCQIGTFHDVISHIFYSTWNLILRTFNYIAYHNTYKLSNIYTYICVLILNSKWLIICKHMMSKIPCLFKFLKLSSNFRINNERSDYKYEQQSMSFENAVIVCGQLKFLCLKFESVK